MNETIRVAVVDDHPLFRDGVIASLRADENIQVVGQGASSGDALALAQ